MTEVDLDAIVAAAEGATPGPWHLTEYGDIIRPSPVAELDVFSFWAEQPHSNDVAFIAAVSPDVVLALVERVRVAEAELAVVESVSQRNADAHMLAKRQVRRARAEALEDAAIHVDSQDPNQRTNMRLVSQWLYQRAVYERRDR